MLRFTGCFNRMWIVLFREICHVIYLKIVDELYNQLRKSPHTRCKIIDILNVDKHRDKKFQGIVVKRSSFDLRNSGEFNCEREFFHVYKKFVWICKIFARKSMFEKNVGYEIGTLHSVKWIPGILTFHKRNIEILWTVITC